MWTDVIVAEGSTYPTAFQAISIIAICAAIALPILGKVRVHAVMNWWLTRPPVVIRCSGILVVAFGLFLVQALRNA